MTTLENLPVRAWRSHVRFLEDATDIWREVQEKAFTLFPAAEVLRLAVNAAQIVCTFWDQSCASAAAGGSLKPATQETLLAMLRDTDRTLGAIRAVVGKLPQAPGQGPGHLLASLDLASLERVAADVADRQAEADMGLPWDTSAAPKVSPEAARRGKEAARAGRLRDLEEVSRDPKTRG